MPETVNASMLRSRVDDVSMESHEEVMGYDATGSDAAKTLESD
jgi:hypothetical protein